MNTLVTPYTIHGDFLAKPSMTKHQDLIAAVKGIQGLVAFDSPLRELTTLRIGGPADALVVPKDIDDVCRLMAQAHQAQVPLYVLGAVSYTHLTLPTILLV